jgi:hypothetical protein
MPRSPTTLAPGLRGADKARARRIASSVHRSQFSRCCSIRSMSSCDGRLGREGWDSRRSAPAGRRRRLCTREPRRHVTRSYIRAGRLLRPLKDFVSSSATDPALTIRSPKVTIFTLDDMLTLRSLDLIKGQMDANACFRYQRPARPGSDATGAIIDLTTMSVLLVRATTSAVCIGCRTCRRTTEAKPERKAVWGWATARLGRQGWLPEAPCRTFELHAAGQQSGAKRIGFSRTLFSVRTNQEHGC